MGSQNVGRIPVPQETIESFGDHESAWQWPAQRPGLGLGTTPAKGHHCGAEIAGKLLYVQHRVVIAITRRHAPAPTRKLS